MNDAILIEDLEVMYRVGVPEAERAAPQRLLVSIRMETKRFPRSDRIEETIDYHAVTRSLMAFGEGRSWKLIETLAGDIATHILATFRPVRVGVTIKKFILPETRFVGVEISRPSARR